MSEMTDDTPLATVLAEIADYPSVYPPITIGAIAQEAAERIRGLEDENAGLRERIHDMTDDHKYLRCANTDLWQTLAEAREKIDKLREKIEKLEASDE